jgi:hypothetical protein
VTDEQARGVAGAALLRLVEVMDTLRVSCPWDARQTHESLAPHLLEESYEALEALEGGDEAALQDELGDVLLQDRRGAHRRYRVHHRRRGHGHRGEAGPPAPARVRRRTGVRP